MFASSTGPRSALRRRGIVLVLVLGMLGLMALIGVTFATFAGQSLKNGRNFSQGVARPQAEALMDYALAQLINDTNNPLSAIRGHSLLRDMYGNDSVFRGANPPANSVAETGGLLSQIYDSTIPGYRTLHFTKMQARSSAAPPATPFYNNFQYATNIPTGGPYQGYDFTRWIIRFAPAFPNRYPQAAQTFEILEDDFSGAYHNFTLSVNLGNGTTDLSYIQYGSTNQPGSSSDWTSFIYNDPNLGAPSGGKSYTTLAQELSTVNGSSPGSIGGAGNYISNPFVLDGRYMRAFNGPGLTRPVNSVPSTDANVNPVANSNYPYNFAAYGNMRIANFDPDTFGMDEDYDACDLENWFLAIQSADGQVMIPSFHRPGILTALDWTVPTFDVSGNIINRETRAKILRPRRADHSPLFPPDPSVVDTSVNTTSSGKLTYDIDNDGDGVTDSVWLDLGYPVQRDPNGKLYKPLFAFMVLGLNGRLPLNTVGNLQARAIGDTTNNTAPGVLHANSSGQAPYPGFYAADPTNNRYPHLSSQVFFDAPLYDHASHLGYSVNEINPKFALQNAPTNLYPRGNGQSAYGVYTDTTAPQFTTQFDDVGVSVALTQMRNILAGTMSNDVANFDRNFVYVNGQPFTLPNNVADGNDNNFGNPLVARGVTAIPGRWGEPEGIPRVLNYPLSSTFGAAFNTGYPTLYYNNTVRAGRSYFLATGPTNYFSKDSMDDDFDALDPYLPNPVENPALPQQYNLTTTGGAPDIYTIPLNATTLNASTFSRLYPEDVDGFDNAGQRAIASERSRLYVTPQDPVGVGRRVAFMTRPGAYYDYGTGADGRGRVGFFRYFRPAGMPQEVRYPYPDNATGTSNFSYTPYFTNSGNGQRYLMPVLLPAGQSTASGGNRVTTPDVSNNQFHGLQAAMTPELVASATPPPPAITESTIAPFAAMPFDWDPSTGAYPTGYNDTDLGGGVKLHLFSPTINPNGTAIQSNVNTENGPNIASSPYTYSFVVNGYLAGSLNKDEADEMNLYLPNSHDMPYGPTDLEWLYRKHDIDGASLNSRLSQLAPVSFLNPSDGLTRRRLFSTDSWELNSFVYANDNPIPYAGKLGSTANPSTDHDFTYNSRFGPNASPSLEIMNQVVASNTSFPYIFDGLSFSGAFANPITTEFLPNPTFPIHAGTTNIYSYQPNSAYASSRITMPQPLDPTVAAGSNVFVTNAFPNAHVAPYTNVIIPQGDTINNHPLSAAQVQTPTLAHRDRKINLNFPLPISNDPAEPIRQKWCRETYQMLKAILPPSSVDTPEELAALSQFVVNIVDFRDTDCTMTRFVNTDLEVTDVLSKTATNAQQDPFDLKWTVSPAGVKFSITPLPVGNHFPYDPSLYSPDLFPPTPYLVQHGMEYNPIALNEVMAYQAEYGASATSNTVTPYHAMFIELVNTLTESQNNNNSTANSSAISLASWDIVIAPDNYGWGRPDPISGDVNQVILPPYVPNPSGSTGQAPDPTQRQHASSADPNLQQLQKTVMRTLLTNPASPGNNPIIKGINGTRIDHFVVGDYRTGANTSPTSVSDPTPIEGTNAVAKSNEIDVRLPTTFTIPIATNNTGQYYWIYLRRPANPFDTDPPNQVRPNKEMVVVDAMRFPVISATGAMITTSPPTGTSAPVITKSVNTIYSAQRLQPYRGGHLVRVDTDPTINPTMAVTALPPGGPKKISPPSPPYAYGYSEQTAPPASPGNGYGSIPYTTTNAGVTTTNYAALTQTYQQSINNTNPISDVWAHFPFHDRDFANVAELLLVPGCPPGLFTKQFVEEPYPGNVFADTNNPHTTTAAGTDNRDFATTIVAPVGTTNPSLVGRKDFNPPAMSPPIPTFPYLTDNFYYTAASVAPPSPGTGVTINPGYTQMTTEIGGWTGTGWHKMMEFFEVPSSANGAIGTTDGGNYPFSGGNNYDWYRADVKPGPLNLNLLIDEEVFAGLIDDPRLNEALVSRSLTLADGITPFITTIPYVVNQIDSNGYPAYNTTTGQIYGHQPIFAPFSANNLPLQAGHNPVGRGYVYRDPDINHYPGGNPLPYQQVHGLKAAFSDFLKLRHGGSGYLFAHGAGPIGHGDYTPGPLGLPASTQPIASDRPYRSLSYPDINYTIMRPASLPPTLSTTTPLLPANLSNLFTYSPTAGPGAPYVQFNITQSLAPMNDATTPYQYVQDPGIKNPYLAVQYVNTAAPGDMQPAATDPPLSRRRLAPPYEATEGPSESPPRPVAAPFPPPIPPTPARRLFQIPDATVTSNASYIGGYDAAAYTAHPERGFPVNEQVSTPLLSNAPNQGKTITPNQPPTPPSLVVQSRAVFAPDNYMPQSSVPLSGPQANNFLGAGATGSAVVTNDLRQHPVYRTEWIQKLSNLTTVRTHQFATWITVGFFEVVRTGTPELGIPDVLGQELGSSAGKKIRFRSFFVIDRTKATGFNPYYPGNFRDCVTYRRRIE